YYNIYLSSNPDEIYRYKAEQSVRQKNKEGVSRFIDGTLIEGIGTADKFYFFFFSNECQTVKATKLEPQTISLCGKTLNIEPYISK
ncbi:hypothetical protein ACPV5G_21310, partial [Photobacterium damselae]|uniref:hypothetical protein n=1 Tax=Photobacterium damselae TaxID=38293 RepID=UPI00406799AF